MGIVSAVGIRVHSLRFRDIAPKNKGSAGRANGK